MPVDFFLIKKMDVISNMKKGRCNNIKGVKVMKKVYILKSKKLFTVFFGSATSTESDSGIVDQVIPLTPERSLAKHDKQPDANGADKSFSNNDQSKGRQMRADDFSTHILAISRCQHALKPIHSESWVIL